MKAMLRNALCPARATHSLANERDALRREIDAALFSRSGRLALTVAVGLVLAPDAAQAASIAVTDGAVDVAPNGNCSLVEAVQSANTNTGFDGCMSGSGIVDTLVLPAGSIFTFNGFHDTSEGFTALPLVTTAITIEGNGATIERSSAAGTPHFRLIRTAASGQLSLNDLALRNGSVIGNFPESAGGAIVNGGGSVTVTNSTISGNMAASYAGGVLNVYGTVSIANSTISGNTADQGGGMASFANLPGAATTIINSTISGNTASGFGGGILNVNGSTVISHSTITNNAAPAGYGSGVAGFGATFAQTRIDSSIVSGNANTDIDFVFGATNSFSSHGDNLIGDGNASGAFTAAGDQISVVDPGLDPLADNGGPTLTHAVRPSSPALDAVTTACPPPATDQRGVPRPSGAACDIGSFEYDDLIFRDGFELPAP